MSGQHPQPQVRVLTLNNGEHLDTKLFRLQKGWIIQLRPGPSLLGKKVNVYTNNPLEENNAFDRTSYHQLHWRSDTSNKGDDTALFVEITIVMAGSFHYYFTFDNDSSRESAAGSGYYLVDPSLTVGIDKEVIPLDCIQCQTVLSKCVGPLNKWEARLKVSKESGYNMVHFTPLQELGASNSAYSLADQQKLNPTISTKEYNFTFEDVEKFTKKMRDEWKVLSLTDIVLNHTANESPWLQEHPEATYNCVNSPHLRPTYLLDRALYRMTNDVSMKRLPDDIIPHSIKSEDDIQLIKKALYTHYIPPLKLHEFYQVDVDKAVMVFKQRISGNAPVSTESYTEQLIIIQDSQYRRNSSKIDIDLAIKLYNKKRPDAANETDRVDKCCEMLKRVLELLNQRKATQIRGHLDTAVECCLGTIRYEYLAADGPKRKEVNHPSNHLVPPFFTSPGAEGKSLSEEESLAFGPEGCFCMAHNGWVMGADALKNFAEEDSMVYLRRELVAWGDSVKLRFGQKPKDSPFLWDFMSRYVKYTARIFDGIRLDNCHSTPIHVAEYLLDEARKVNPDLYVIAELFTSSEDIDNIFINRLGINSLIREAMSAPDSHEQGRLVYRYGGKPVGAFLLPPVRPLVPAVAHAIFMDLSHDNRAPAEVRTAWDMLPSSALVAMACCGSGSNRGYDELVPHHIHVVNEKRMYKGWTESSSPQSDEINSETGIIRCKNLLNDLHFELGMSGFSEVYVDQVTENVVTVTRHNPVTHQTVVLVAYQVFKPISQMNRGNIRPLKVEGRLEEIVFEMKTKTKITGCGDKRWPGNFTRDSKFINGLTDIQAEVKERIQPSRSSMVKVTTKEGSDMTECEYLPDFTPGSIIAFRFSLVPRAQSAVNKIRGVLSEFGYRTRISEVTTHNSKLNDILNNLSLADYNRILYRCDAEEREENRPGAGTYDIPNYGPFPYCGLQGVISLMSEIRANNDLGHPLCNNLREGDWMMDFIINRLKSDSGTEKLANWIERKLLSQLKELPRYLVPAYFDSVITSLYLTFVNKAWTMLGEFVSGGSDFAKGLGLCSLQFCGRVKSSLLPELSPALLPPQPPQHHDAKGQLKQMSVTLAAGLPHFSTGYMRCWGRDTFIALPGNLLITERYQEARWIILGFAGTLRHGLIPNLLDGGRNARFNCRDAIWFWLFSIQKYVEMAPEGYRILKDKVSRLYPTDDATFHDPGKCDQLLEDVIQEALQRHFQGVRFRERNAGFQIDREMNEHGFNNEIGVDLNTGFVFGGNINNCGTWMDKMGSSEKAGTKGKPATPRDGSAVEIVGLSKAALKFLSRMYREYKYSYNHVERVDDTGKTTKWTYEFWENKIKENFEKFFYIHETPKPELEPKPELINKRGIIKDSINSGVFWADYQLRCNFPIAIASSPDILSPEHAWKALKNAEKHLLGPLGIRTLDPSDWTYRGDYDNSNDSTDNKLARGYNYHQGPEWLWPVGWLLRAQLAIAPKVGGQAELHHTMNNIKSILSAHYSHLFSEHWRSLPELTNSNGSYCRDSNPAQSWSTGCILEVLWEMDQIERGIQRSI